MPHKYANTVTGTINGADCTNVIANGVTGDKLGGAGFKSCFGSWLAILRFTFTDRPPGVLLGLLDP